MANMPTPPQPHGPLFSLVTVCLNPGQDLALTVDSVLRQDFDDYELLIKDGGSTDGTEALEWEDPRVKRHCLSDAGIWDAMNQALRLAEGQNICFLNAGDIFEDGYVLSFVAGLINSNPRVEFLYGDVRKPQSRSGVELYPDRLSRFYLFGHMICHQCWFLRRQTYLLVGGFETQYTIGSDYRLLLRLLLLTRVRYLHAPLLAVRYKGDGFSTLPQNRRTGRASTDEMRKQVFSKVERAAFGAAYALQRLFKRVIYDHVLCHPWRAIQGRRVSRRQRAR